MFIGEGKFESLLKQINQDILLEKRRGGYADPSVIDQLEKYKDGKYFISFSSNLQNREFKQRDSDVKLGINPKNPHNTPTGIYSYPIWAYWDRINQNAIHYASDRRNIFVFKPKNEDRVAYASSYTKEQMEDDYRKVFNISRPESISSQEIEQEYKRFFRVNSHYPDHPLTFIWNFLRTLSGRNVHKWAALLYKLYDGIVDDLDLGIIYPSEPTQGVFFNSRAIKVVDLIKRPKSTAGWGGETSAIIRSKDELENFINSRGDYVYYLDIRNIKDPSLDVDINRFGIGSLVISQSRFKSIKSDVGWIDINGSKIDEVYLTSTINNITITGNTDIKKFMGGQYSDIKELTLKNTSFNPFEIGIEDYMYSKTKIELYNWRGDRNTIPSFVNVVDLRYQI